MKRKSFSSKFYLQIRDLQQESAKLRCELSSLSHFEAENKVLQDTILRLRGELEKQKSVGSYYTLETSQMRTVSIIQLAVTP